VDDEVISGLLKIPRKHFWLELASVPEPEKRERTITTHVQVNDIANADVDDAQEALVLLLELLLIKDLDG
jgi:hypothetical protein